VAVEPASEDDWELVEIHANLMEEQLLNQVRQRSSRPSIFTFTFHLCLLPPSGSVKPLMQQHKIICARHMMGGSSSKAAQTLTLQSHRSTVSKAP